MQRIILFLNKHRETRNQFIKFGFVGLGNTILDLGVYILLTRSLHFFAVNYLLANTISWICAVMFSFTMNRYWTFKAHFHSAARTQYAKFFIVSVVSLLLSQITLFVAVDVVGIHDLAGKAASIVIVMFWNFFMNKKWTFRHAAVQHINSDSSV